jgi:dipeptidyl aminopeptidase/acylaminoacyl peptidase
VLQNVLLGELGVAIVLPNVRGSEGYGRTFRAMDDALLRDGAVRDVGAVLDWIATQPDLDASRVAVAGGSYGGFLALATLVRYGDRLRAGIDIAGPADLLAHVESGEEWKRALRRPEFGDERDPATREFLSQLSPMTHVAKIRQPILVVHGRNDPRVMIQQSERLIAALRAQGTSEWFATLEKEGHGMASLSAIRYVAGLQVHFLNQHLLAESVTFGATPEQLYLDVIEDQTMLRPLK